MFKLPIFGFRCWLLIRILTRNMFVLNSFELKPSTCLYTKLTGVFKGLDAGSSNPQHSSYIYRWNHFHAFSLNFFKVKVIESVEIYGVITIAKNYVQYLVCLPITSLFNLGFLDASFEHWVTYSGDRLHSRVCYRVKKKLIESNWLCAITILYVLKAPCICIGMDIFHPSVMKATDTTRWSLKRIVITVVLALLTPVLQGGKSEA